MADSISSSFLKRLIFNPKKTQSVGDSFHIQNKRFIYENRTIKTKDDTNLRISLVIPKEISKNTQFIILCHGSSVSRSFYAKLFEKYDILDEDICCLILDYREFGNSEGVFTSRGSILDLEACASYFFRRFGKKFALIGSSLGSAIIIEYCKNTVEKGNLVLYNKVILMSSFISVKELLKEFSFWKFAKMFPKQIKRFTDLFDYESLERITVLKGSCVLVMHGINDKVVPKCHSEKLALACGGEISFFREDHFSLGISSCAWKRIFEFLKNE